MEPRRPRPASPLRPLALVVAIAIALVLPLSGCTPQAEPPPASTADETVPGGTSAAEDAAISAGESYARDLDARLDETGGEPGTWSFGDASSDLTVWREDGRPVLIEEVRTDTGNSTKRYYFRDGSLVYYRESTRVADFAPDRGSPNPVAVQRGEQTVEIRLAFGDDGEAVDAVQTVDGVEEPLTGFIEPAVRRHAEELLEAAGAAASSAGETGTVADRS
jgi:hypothetical protein